MQSKVHLSFLFKAKCLPIANDDVLSSDEDLADVTYGAQNPKVIDVAKDLLEKLRSEGKNSDANKLWNAIQCALDKLRAVASLTGREMSWNIKGIQDSFKSAQDKLNALIRDLKHSNNYSD